MTHIYIYILILTLNIDLPQNHDIHTRILADWTEDIYVGKV